MSMATKGSDIEYPTGNDRINGYLASPVDGKQHPGVIVIHEIFGLDPHTRSVADRMASEGYVALAPDLFSSRKLSEVITREGIAATMEFIMSIPPDKQRDENYRENLLNNIDNDKRKVIMDTYNMLLKNRPVDLLTGYLSSGVDYLHSLETVNGKIGSVGFCFGGGMSISLGCTGKVDATAIYYGENPEPLDKLKNVKNAVIGFYAGEDRRITSKVPELVSKLFEYNKEVSVKIYPGAYHAFFNSTRPTIYNKRASEDSWRLLMSFYREIFGM